MWERLLKGVQDVLFLSREVEELSKETAAMSRDVRELDNRVTRLEAIVEVSGGGRPRLRRVTPR